MVVRAGIVERCRARAVVCLGWLRGRCGCVEISGGEDGPFEYECGTGVYGMESHADLVDDESTNCRASAAWLLGVMGISIGSGRGRMRGELPKGGSYRRSAELECADNSGAQRKVVPRQNCHFHDFDFGFHNINQVDKVTPPCDKWVRQHGPGDRISPEAKIPIGGVPQPMYRWPLNFIKRKDTMCSPNLLLVFCRCEERSYLRVSPRL